MVAAPGRRRALAAGRGRDRLRRRRPGLPHRRLLVRRLRRAGGDRGGRRAVREHAAAAIWRRRRSRSPAAGSRSTATRRSCGSCSRRSGWRRRSPARATRRRARAARRATWCAIRSWPTGSSGSLCDGAAPFYTGDIAAAVADWVFERGGTLTRADLAAFATIPREPVRVRYHGREVLTNPPPSAGGLLIAYALALLERGSGRPDPPRSWPRWRPRRPSARRRSSRSSARRASWSPSCPRGWAPRRTSRVLDSDGWACAVTTTNGEGSGIVVPGTGIHVNNMMGEEDLSPAGWFTHPPGRRLPSMMAPTVVLDEGSPELVLGCAGSNRIRSAILQVIVNAIDHGMEAQAAVDAPRLHLEDGWSTPSRGSTAPPWKPRAGRVARGCLKNTYTVSRPENQNVHVRGTATRPGGRNPPTGARTRKPDGFPCDIRTERA